MERNCELLLKFNDINFKVYHSKIVHLQIIKRCKIVSLVKYIDSSKTPKRLYNPAKLSAINQQKQTLRKMQLSGGFGNIKILRLTL